MALIDLDIVRTWDTDDLVTNESNWDAIRVPLVEYADATNNNLQQIGQDIFGSDYDFFNDGMTTQSVALADNPSIIQVDSTPVSVTGIWSFQTITDLGTVGTADINGGTADGMTIGATTPAAGTFTALNVTSTTRYYVVQAANFIPWLGSQVNDRSTSGALPRIYNVNGGFASRTFFAPVHLPHGATVTSISMNYYRDDASASIAISFKRQQHESYGGLVQEIRYLAGTTTGGDHSVSGAVSSWNVIDNQTYAYRIHVIIDNNDATTDTNLMSVVLTYTVTSTSP